MYIFLETPLKNRRLLTTDAFKDYNIRGSERILMSQDMQLKIFNKGEIQVRQKSEVKEPKLYKVIIHNDNYTTMDFVVSVIITIFNKPAAEATKIMLQVHNEGSGVAGIYTYDMATTMINQVHIMARAKEFPLRCSFEEA